MIQNLNPVLRAAAIVQEAAPELQKLKKATDGLESYMFKSLLETMGGKKGLFGSNVPGGQIYKDMVEQNLADLLAERGVLKIGQTIFEKVAPNALNQAQINLAQKAKLQISNQTGKPE